MTRIENTFEGGTDGTSITTGNSGGASGTAWNAVPTSGTGVYDDDTPAPLVGTMSGLLTATTGQTPYFLWSSAWQSETEVWFRGYFYKTGNPTSNTIIAELAVSSTAGCDLRITSTGTLQLRDGTKTARYTSAALANNTWHRIEWRVLHSTTVGRLEARIYSGANVHGATPDESVGSPSSNWNTAASSNELRVGIVSNPSTAGLTLYVDDLALDDTGWIGSSVVDSSEPLGAVTNLTVTPTTGLEAAAVDWDAVLDADGYAIELQILDPGGDPGVEEDWTAVDTFTTTTATDLALDDTDGLIYGRSFRLRVRATTTDDD